MSHQNAMKRIMKDYRELLSLEHNFSLEPLESDFMTWHGNLVPQYGRYQGFLIHYEIKFTDDYPLIPPKVFLRVMIPHKNVFYGWDKNRENLSICLDLIKLFSLEGYKKVKTSSYLGGWSSSYSLTTILLQLESFLFQDEAEQDNGEIIRTYSNSNSTYWHGYGDIDNLVKHSPFYKAYRDCLKYECPQCGHTYQKPYPPLKTELPPLRLAPELIIPLMDDKNHLTDQFVEWLLKEFDQKDPKVISAFQASFEKILPLIEATNLSQFQSYLEDLNELKGDPCHGYLLEHHDRITKFFKDKMDQIEEMKKLDEMKKLEGMKKTEDSIDTTPIIPIKHCCGKLDWLGCVKHHQCNDCQDDSHNFLNSLKAKGFEVEEDPHQMSYQQVSTDIQNFQGSINYLEIPVDQIFDRLISLVNSGLLKYDFETCFDQFIYSMGYYPDLKPVDWDYTKSLRIKRPLPEIVCGSGYTLHSLPTQLKLSVLDRLSYRSRSTLSHLSDDLKVIINDPYILERNQLQCFHSRQVPEESYLGYLVNCQYFPDSSIIRNMEFSLDLASYDSYQEGLRKTSLNQRTQFWLPIYLSKYHSCRSTEFYELVKSKIIEIATSTRRVLKLTGQCADKIWSTQDDFDNCKDPEKMDADGHKVYTFDQRMDYLKSKMTDDSLWFENFAIEVLSNLMSSAIVEMMKGDIVVSNKALEGYCRWHRLFYFLAKHNPKIQEIVDAKLGEFIDGGPRKRHKSVIPNLGQFLSYLSISEKYGWKHLQKDYLDECLKRNIFWILKDDKSWKPSNAMSFLPKLNDIWQLVQVGKKLNLFYHYFLTQVAKPKGKSLPEVMDTYDYYYGFPSREIRDQFQKEVKKISEITSWKGFYQELGLHFHGPKYLSKQLYRAYNISNKIGYNAALKLDLDPDVN